MHAITYIMWLSNLACVSTFLLYTSLFIQPYKQDCNGVSSGDIGSQLIQPQLIKERVIGMLHHRMSIMRRGVQHISIFYICEDVWHYSDIPTLLLSVVTTANWLFTPIHVLQTVAQYSGREGQYWVPNPNYCTVKSQKSFGIGHMYT
jgi:hypothetical protein